MDTSKDRPPSLVTIIRLMDGPLTRATLELAVIADVAKIALSQWAIGKGGSLEKHVVTIMPIVESYASPASARATECFRWDAVSVHCTLDLSYWACACHSWFLIMSHIQACIEAPSP